MSNLVKIGDKYHAVSQPVAEEFRKLRRDLREAQVVIGLTLAPGQQYYAGTPVSDVMTELYQLRECRKDVERVLADSTEHFDWADAIESVDRVRKLLVPMLEKIKKTEEQG